MDIAGVKRYIDRFGCCNFFTAPSLRSVIFVLTNGGCFLWRRGHRGTMDTKTAYKVYKLLGLHI